MTSNVDIRIPGSGWLGEAKTEETEEAKEEEERRTAVRYLLVRHIRD